MKYAQLILVCLTFSATVGGQSLSFDRDVIFIPCPQNKPERFYNTCDKHTAIRVGFANSNGEPVSYSVTGGTIVVKGTTVDWNLQGLAPGTYVITAKQGSSVITKAATVINCSSCNAECLRCPDLNIHYTPNKVRKGSTIEIFFDDQYGEPAHTWIIRGAKILYGQGTPRIRVKVTSPRSVVVRMWITEKDSFCFDAGWCRKESKLTIPVQNR